MQYISSVTILMYYRMTTENYMYRSNKEEFFQYHDVIKQVGRYEIYHKLIFKKEK